MTPCTDEINRVSNAYIIPMVLKSSQNILTALILLFKYDLIRQGSLKVHRDNKNMLARSIHIDVEFLVD